jgi:hypothetical protein
LARGTADALSSGAMVVPLFLPGALPGMLSYHYRARKMGFGPFRPALDSVAVSHRRAMAGLCAISASVMQIARPNALRPLPGFCSSRNFRKR